MNYAADELLKEFESGRFLRPDWSQPNPVALARAISGFAGHSPWESDAATTEVAGRIGEPDHLVMVIADGFGMNFVDTLPADSFSRTHLAWEQPALFPSSTGPNMTALFSGEWPAQHGFTGWWVYVPQIGERATVYEWRQTSDGKSLSDLGVRPEDFFLSQPFPGKTTVDCHVIMPGLLKNSLPTLYSEAGGAPMEGFDDIEDGVEIAARRVRHAEDKSLTMLYWNLVDVSAHAFGTGAEETARSVNGFDAMLGELASAIEGKARLVVTADHGHLDVSDHVSFGPSHRLAALMECTQSGEPRASYMHVKPGEQERFAAEFREHFSEHFILLGTDELVELQLLGPEPPSPAVMKRIGNFIAISRGGPLLTSRSNLDPSNLLASTHGGLTRDEMMVPVLLA